MFPPDRDSTALAFDNVSGRAARLLLSEATFELRSGGMVAVLELTEPQNHAPAGDPGTQSGGLGTRPGIRQTSGRGQPLDPLPAAEPPSL